MAISDNTRFVKLRRPDMRSPTRSPPRCERRAKITLVLKSRPKIILRLPGLRKIKADREMRIKAEQQDESESTPEQVAAGREEIEQRIRELVLEAEADKSGPVIKVEELLDE